MGKDNLYRNYKGPSKHDLQVRKILADAGITPKLDGTFNFEEVFAIKMARERKHEREYKGKIVDASMSSPSLSDEMIDEFLDICAKAKVTERQLKPLYLRLLGYSFNEIAGILKVEPYISKGQTYRTIRRIRKFMGGEYVSIIDIIRQEMKRQ